MRFCKKCGMKVKEKALLCPSCLSALDSPYWDGPISAQPAQPEPSAPPETPTTKPTPFQLWLESTMNGVMPWFWPSAFEAAEVKENPVLKLVKDAGIDEKTERRRRWNCQVILVLNLVLLVLGLIALFVWNAPAVLSITSSLLVLFMVPIVLVVYSSIRIYTQQADIVGLAIEANHDKPADVLWALMHENRLSKDSLTDPAGDRNSHLFGTLVFTVFFIVAHLVEVRFLGNVDRYPDKNILFLYFATMNPLMIYVKVTFGFVEFGRFSPRLLIMPLVLLAAVMVYNILIICSSYFLIESHWMVCATGIVFIWLINWLCERIPYWEIESRLKVRDTNQ